MDFEIEEKNKSRVSLPKKELQKDEPLTSPRQKESQNSGLISESGMSFDIGALCKMRDEYIFVFCKDFYCLLTQFF